MKHQYRFCLAVLGVALTLVGCSSSSNVTVVSSIPGTIDPADRPPAADGSDFQVIRYGELDQIRSLDPLFALNPASQRIVQLIHEGLVGLDENARVVPRLAASWDVTTDSLTWVFTLRDNAFFHDSRVFINGIGRKVTGMDVYHSFRRMAGAGVPNEAAELFRNSIQGFDAYFQEQHHIYFAQDRMISDISGIRVIDNRTVQFNLSTPDPDFLFKLASPLAVIYPIEAYATKQSAEGGSPVGTGPFRYERAFGDTLIVLERNARYWEPQASTAIDRIEIINQRLEAELFKKFARQEIDFIAEMGPQMVRTLLNSAGELEQSYRDRYELIEQQAQTYNLFFNANNSYQFTQNDVLYLLRGFNPQAYVENMGSATVELLKSMPQPPQGYVATRVAQFDTSRNIINVSYNGNLIAGDFLLYLTQRNDSGLPMRIYRTPLVTRELLMYAEQPGSYIPERANPAFRVMPAAVDSTVADSLKMVAVVDYYEPDLLMQFRVKRYAIVNKNVQGIRLNPLSWWLDFRSVTIRPQPS